MTIRWLSTGGALFSALMLTSAMAQTPGQSPPGDETIPFPEEIVSVTVDVSLGKEPMRPKKQVALQYYPASGKTILYPVWIIDGPVTVRRKSSNALVTVKPDLVIESDMQITVYLRNLYNNADEQKQVREAFRDAQADAFAEEKRAFAAPRVKPDTYKATLYAKAKNDEIPISLPVRLPKTVREQGGDVSFDVEESVLAGLSGLTLRDCSIVIEADVYAQFRKRNFEVQVMQLATSLRSLRQTLGSTREPSVDRIVHVPVGGGEVHRFEEFSESMARELEIRVVRREGAEVDKSLISLAIEKLLQEVQQESDLRNANDKERVSVLLGNRLSVNATVGELRELTECSKEERLKRLAKAWDAYDARAHATAFDNSDAGSEKSSSSRSESNSSETTSQNESSTSDAVRGELSVRCWGIGGQAGFGRDSRSRSASGYQTKSAGSSASSKSDESDFATRRAGLSQEAREQARREALDTLDQGVEELKQHFAGRIPTLTGIDLHDDAVQKAAQKLTSSFGESVSTTGYVRHEWNSLPLSEPMLPSWDPRVVESRLREANEQFDALNRLREQLSSLEKRLSAAAAGVEEIKASVDFKAAADRMAAIQKEIGELRKSVDDSRKASADLAAAVAKTADDLEKKLADSVKRVEQFSAEYDKLRALAGELSGVKSTINKQLEELKKAAESRSAVITAAATPPANPKPGDVWKVPLQGVDFEFAWCPPGTFKMGSPANEPNRDEDEDDTAGPGGRQVDVTISQGFWLARTETTQAQFRALTGRNPSWFSASGGGKDEMAGMDTANFPVEFVTWYDAVEYCNLLSTAAGLPSCYEITGLKRSSDGGIKSATVKHMGGKGFRLPTEAEWEYACRAGTKSAYWFMEAHHEPASALGKYAWYWENSGRRTQPVGSKPANPWGLFDMHGNCWEWTGDRYADRLVGGTDPRNDTEGQDRVVRGGSWFNDVHYTRSANRYRYSPGNRDYKIGFRVARTP